MQHNESEPTLDAAEIHQIVQAFTSSPVAELRLEVGDVTLVLSRKGYAEAGPEISPPSVARSVPGSALAQAGVERSPRQESQDAPASSATDETSDPSLVQVCSPLVGIFYRRPAPDRKPYVEVGDEVDEDTVVCTVEVMKMFNEVAAGCRGVVQEIRADDGGLVEHGQVLMLIAPSG